MGLSDRIRLIPRSRKSDARGWLLKVLSGTEEVLPLTTCEIYLVSASPGQSRGNHYHRIASEWFTVVQGAATAVLADIESGERLTLQLTEDQPTTLFVPPGVGHVFTNGSLSRCPLLLHAYSDTLFDPRDTYPCALNGDAAR